MKLSKLIVEFMKLLGIKYCFGIPGSNAPLIYEIKKENSIKLILTKHENNAVFMATGITKSTGKPAACFGTMGPGVLNMVEAIASAYHDSQPVLILTGSIPPYLEGKNAFQETSGKGNTVNQQNILKQVTKFYAKITEKNLKQIGENLSVAYRILSSKEGPVCLDISPDVVEKEIKNFDQNLLKKKTREVRSEKVNTKNFEKCLSYINKKTKIALLCGYGCILSNTPRIIKKFSEKFFIPVITTLKGKGVISESHFLNFGCVGLCGTKKANRVAQEIELLIAVGTSLSQFTTNNYKFFKKIPIIQIDKSRKTKAYKKVLFLKGDIKQILQQFLEKLKKNKITIENRKLWIESLHKTKEEKKSAYYREMLRPEYFVSQLRKYLPKDAIICTESVQWTSRFFPIYLPRTHIVSTGLAPIGCSLPEAIGCKLANPNRIVVSLQGDGGFQMCGMELMTAVNYKIPIIAIVLNNGVLGPIFLHQIKKYKKAFFSVFRNPNFELLAKSFGINYIKIRKVKDIKSKIPLAIKLNKERKIVLVEVKVTPYEKWT